MRKLEAKDIKDIGLLKHYRIVRKWACKNNNLNDADLELLIYFDCMDLFTRQDFLNGTYTYSWDKRRWQRLVREGLIVVWRHRNNTTQKYSLYKTSVKCKLLINKIYRILLGQEDLPTSKQRNVIMQGSSGKNFEWKNSTAYLNLSDNARLTLGTSDDLSIYHDGSNSILKSPSHAIAHYSNTRHHFLNADGSANVAVLSPQGQCDFYNNGTLKLEVEGNGIQVHNGGIDLNRQQQPYSAAIYFAGFGDTNHMLWQDYWDNPNGTRGSGNGWDGVKWNVYNGLRLFHGNEAETIAAFNGNGACELWYNNVKQINTHPNGIFVRGIYPMSDNTFDIGSSSQRFKRLYATNGTIQTSDRDQKNTIVESDLGLDFVNKLKPVSFKWNEDDGKTHYGLIAQEVEETLLDIGKTASDLGALSKEDDSPMGLSYSELISPLIKAVQDLKKENDDLKTLIKNSSSFAALKSSL